MRVTKQLQEQIFNNLLNADHPLKLRADSVTRDISNAAVTFLDEIKQSSGLDDTTLSEIGSRFERQKTPVNASNFIRSYVESKHPRALDEHHFNDYYYVNVGGCGRSLRISGRIDGFGLTGYLVNRELSHNLVSANKDVFLPLTTIVVPGDHWLADFFIMAEAEIESINREFISFKATVFATLNKFTTVKKLVASWPEIEPYIPSQAPAAVGTGVALSVDQLNAICGIPK